MGSEYLAALKKEDLDAVEAKIQEAPMIYKGITKMRYLPTCLSRKLFLYVAIRKF